jgi:DNA recombination protein RmuC
MPTELLIPVATLVLGLVIGLAIAARFSAQRAQAAANQARAEAQTQLALLEQQLTLIPKLEAALTQAQAETDRLSAQLSDLRQQLGAAQSTITARDEQLARDAKAVLELTQARESLESQLGGLKAQAATLSAELEAERSQGAEKLALLQQAKEQLSLQFKELANEILEDKSKRFTEQNQTNIKQLLDPLHLKLTEFKAQVEKSYDQENKDRSALASQVKQLMELNTQLSDDAKNLTSALKGQSKTRGDWGELMLERVLEVSGLRKDQEYTVQESHTREAAAGPARRGHPPARGQAPGGGLQDLADRLSGIRRGRRRRATGSRFEASPGLHQESHQGALGQELPGPLWLEVPGLRDHVRAHRARLHARHLRRRRPLAGRLEQERDPGQPTTLLFVIRTVAHVWRQEQQNQNAKDIPCAAACSTTSS